MIRLNKAELIVWTMVEAGGQSHGTPRLTFPDENMNQPTYTEWRTACHSAGVHDENVIASYYDNVKLQIGSNVLAYKRELERQIREYEIMLKEPDGCDPNKPLDSWYSDPDSLRFGARIKDKHDLDRMPGDADPKGRRY